MYDFLFPLCGTKKIAFLNSGGWKFKNDLQSMNLLIAKLVGRKEEIRPHYNEHLHAKNWLA